MTRKAETIIVVSELKDLPPGAGRLVTADDFLAGVEEDTRRQATVINLCRSWRYLSKGYYVSLLADARGQTVLPTVDTVEGVLNPHAVFRALQEAGIKTIDVEQMSGRRRSLPETIVVTDDIGLPPRRRRADLPLVRHLVNDIVTYRPAEDAEMAEAVVFLGECGDKRFARLAAQVYRVWPMPLLLLRLLREDDAWKVIQLVPLKVHKLSDAQREDLVRALDRPASKLLPRREPDDDRPTLSVAVLYDENDRHRPSTPETIDRLVKIGAKKGVHVHRIEPGEVARLGDYDALFIRVLTGLELPAFRFALRAEALGMPVIDETRSIIRCSNKVYLHELLSRAGLPMPPTMIATRQTRYEDLAAALRLPFIVKLPDGSFSSAVFKVKGREDYEHRAAELFKESPLVICQAFTPSDFDWRVTTLDGKPLFTCKYHMATGHWQIRDTGPRGARYGRVEAVPRDEAPREVVKLACKAAKLIGEGLHGVDLKETPAGPVIIEVNDNPNIDVGYDDAADGDVIYEELLDAFVRRIEEARRQKTLAAAATAARGDKGNNGKGERREDTGSSRLRRPIGKVPPRAAGETYKAYEVCGLELEYVLVDRDLNAVPLAEQCLAALAGRPASDASLGVVGFSNEIFQHVLELKTEVPLKSLAQSEELLVEGVRRAAGLLAERFDARLLPTGMHPWLDPRKARMWERSNNRIYQTYARLFDTTTHGWANVQALHVNLPLGTEKEAVAMMNAAALLVPYLPAVAASTPIHDGELQPAVDSRLQFIIEHQTKIPESCGEIVPEFVASLAQYKRDVLGPMYRAVEKLDGGRVLRHEFLNARGAVFKLSRESMEVRVLDTQECVKLDVAIAVFVRWALKALADALLSGRMVTDDHSLLVEDFQAVVREGTRARVHAPHLLAQEERDDEDKVEVRRVLHELIAMARKKAPAREEPYLDLVAGIVRQGSLSECMKAALDPYMGDADTFTEAARRLYIQLSECLVENRPWAGRGL
ncbi:MAG: glutamate-cysteine ligase family protein [Planctomycetes bacterium]|nr:glutamate-cysteine ligase family protein [Planctomycetota bacterium]